MGLLNKIQSRFNKSQKTLKQGPEAQTQQTPSAQGQQVEYAPKSPLEQKQEAELRALKQKQEEERRALEQKQQKERDDECKKIYMLLLQKLVKVYAQNDLVVTCYEVNGWNPGRIVAAKTKGGKFVYEVFYSFDNSRYSLDLLSPSVGLTEFGFYSKYPVFQDDKYDYAFVLYGLTANGPSDMTREAIGALMEKDTQIDPSITPVLPSYKMDVFAYLDKFIKR